MTIDDEQFLRAHRDCLDEMREYVQQAVHEVRADSELKADLLTFVRIGAELMREHEEAIRA